MPNIVLSPNKLETKKSELLTLCKMLETEISDLQGIVRSLETEWEGDAADAFQHRSNNQILELKETKKVFTAYSKFLDTAIAEYGKTESANTSLASGC